MSEDTSFENLLVRLRSGESAAATEIFDRYSQQLIGKARARLDSQVKQKIDPEDVVQSVYRSFFRRFDEHQFEFENWQSLWGLLVTITLRKCGRQIEYFYAKMRNVNRESQSAQAEEESVRSCQAIAREPTPQEALILSETLEHVMQRLTNRQRDILAHRLQGYTQQEVSQKIGCSERTVRRTLQLARETLEALWKSDED